MTPTTTDEKKRFYRKLWTLLLPITLQNFMLSLVGVSDALMLAPLSQDAVSAVSLANQIPFILSLFNGGVVMGLSIFEAQYWGRGDLRAFERFFAYATRICSLVALGFALACLFIPERLMQIYTSNLDLIALGAQYLRIVAVSLLFFSVSQMVVCTLKNSERAGRATAISTAAVLINLVLNAIFIFGLLGVPRMGLAGAAWASVIARSVEMIWGVVILIRDDSVKLRRQHLFSKLPGIAREFWPYALPVLGNSVVWGIGFSMYSVILGRLGSDAIAANAIANNVKNLISSLIFGLGSGAAIIIGNELGAGRLQQARVYGDRLIRISLVFGLGSALVYLAVSPLVLRFSNLTDEAHHYLFWMILMSAYNILAMAFNAVTFNGIFVAGGDGKFGFFCDLINMWCVIVPLGFLAAFVFKLPVLAVFFILYLDEVIKIPVVYWNYKRYRWVKDLTVDHSMTF